MKDRFRTLVSRMAALMRHRQMDWQFDEEANLHLDMLAARYIAQGMSREEAHYAARRQFGGVTRAKQELREMRTFPTVETIVRDFRRAFQQLKRAKAFTAAAAFTLALGIGASTAVFAVLDAVVLRPLPFAEPDRLMAFRSADNRGLPHHLSYPDFFDYRRQNRVFERLVCYRDSDFTLTDSTPPVQVAGEIVSWDLFPLLGVQPELGRGFVPDDEEPGAHVVVLSHSLWKNRFGGDKAIAGTSIRINGRPFTVAGVAPAGFQFPVDAPAVELWVTLSVDTTAWDQRGGRMLDAIGRLKPGVSAARAQAQMDVVAGALAQQYPDKSRYARTVVLPELERVAGSSLKPVLILLAAVGMLLLIACANVANLLLARNTARARDFAVRTALGASRWAIVRQVLMEGITLGLLGAVGGVLLALGVLRAVLPLASESIPRISQTSIDERVLVFAAALAVLTSVLFSLAPAVQATGAGPAGKLKAAAQNITRGNDRFRNGLVVLQITLGLILLVGAELLIGAFLQLVRRDPGFRPDHLLTFGIGFSEAQSGIPRQIAFSDRLLERLRAVAGVEAAAMGRPLPLQGNQMRIAFDIEGRPTSRADRPRSNAAIVTPGFFGAMGIPLLKGRDLSERDVAGAAPVIVVNQAFARRFFPGEDVIGKRIRPGAGERPVMREIVGVVGDARQAPIGAEPDPIYYFPYKQLPWGIGSIVLRTAGPPHQFESAARTAVAEVDRLVPIHQVRTGEQLSASVVSQMQFVIILMGGFAVIALLLTVAGLYGVLSYAVERRRRELGVRIALGAGRNAVLGLVFRHALGVVVAGFVLGLAGAAAGGRLLAALIPEVQPLDLMLLTGACCTMMITSMAAAYVPAARAAGVDPMHTLRSE